MFPFLALRFGFGTLALLLIGWKRLLTLRWRGVGYGVLIGLFLFVAYAFQTLGLQYTSASKAGFITGLSVAIVPLLSALLLRRPPTVASIIGVCLATVGLAFLVLNHDLDIVKGDLLVLICALSFALHIVSISAVLSARPQPQKAGSPPQIDALALTIIQVATVALASAVVTLFTHRSWPLPMPSTWFAAGFTGILATAVAFTIQTTMQRFATPTHTALIFAAEPVFAAVFGVLLAHDVMTAQGIVGAILIIVGTLISEINWSERTARIISRFISPHYVSGSAMLVMGLADPISWRRGLLWALGIGLIAIAAPLLLFTRELRKGGISDWHVSNRAERLQPVLIVTLIGASGIPLALLLAFDGPRPLLIAFLIGIVTIVFSLLVTVRWKISLHVSSVAASTTLVTAIVGIGAASLLLLIPLVAWARVKIGAHTVMQTIAGGLSGSVITLLTLRLCGIV